MSSTNRSDKDFVPINGFEDHAVNKNGDVKNLRTNKTLVQSERGGYLRVSLRKNDKKYHRSIHRLVGKAFIPNPENKPQINHIDCDKQNNHYKNLEWCTNSENQLHAWSNGLQRRTERHEKQLAKLVKHNKKTKRTLTNEQVKYIRKKYKRGVNSYRHFGDMFGVSGKTIELVVKNIRYKDVE